MNKFISWLLSPTAVDYSDNPGYIYKRIITWVSSLTVIILLLLLIFLKCNLLTGVITFLTVAGASMAGGAAMGFLFGLPRAEKFRFIKSNNTTNISTDDFYGDNTNLEEVADWVTKIIVGLTLIKLRVIIGWIDMSARSIQTTISRGCNDNHLDFYVFGYSIIILYFLAGGGLVYLWARTNLSIILTSAKKKQQAIQAKELMTHLQAAANQGLNTTVGFALNVNNRFLESEEISNVKYPSSKFTSMVESGYNSKPITDPSDLQHGRWGGEPKRGDYILEAVYNPVQSKMGLHCVQLKIRSLNPDKLLTGEAAFFLHDTFPNEKVYVVANNNLAEISINAWEAFVVGAKLEDGTELELDLNKVKGFPEAFYWKK